jgi:hypothetical protein
LISWNNFRCSFAPAFGGCTCKIHICANVFQFITSCATIRFSGSIQLLVARWPKAYNNLAPWTTIPSTLDCSRQNQVHQLELAGMLKKASQKQIESCGLFELLTSKQPTKKTIGWFLAIILCFSHLSLAKPTKSFSVIFYVFQTESSSIIPFITPCIS